MALPLEAVNKASAREKSIRHGHPSTLHMWWARRPLATARAVIFAQMVDDPSANPDLFPTEKAQQKERQRLFKLIEELVQWESTTNESVLNRARDEIWASWRRACAENADHPRAKELFDRNRLPAFHDPFAGGGTLPLEAQRLGIEAYASDLNPVAVLINKAMIEIPPKFAGRPPVNPEWQQKSDPEKAFTVWKGAQGLAEDVRFYGERMRDEAESRIGYLYPKITITADMTEERPDLKKHVGQVVTVIAWIWARTVKSPNPAFANVQVPLASTFMLSTKAKNEAYAEPVIKDGGYQFRVKVGKPKDPDAAAIGTKFARGANFRCVMSDTPIEGDYVKAEGKAGRMGARLMGIVAEGDSGRFYLSPMPEHEAIAQKVKPQWKPEGDVPARLTGGTCVPYGLTTWGDLFTPRQIVALTVFSDLASEVVERIAKDADIGSGDEPGDALRKGGTGSKAYAEAVGVYLALCADRLADRNSSLCGWDLAQAARGREATVRNVLARQAIPMVWDFAEVNILHESAGGFDSALRAVVRVIQRLAATKSAGFAEQADAARVNFLQRVVSTDPPYFDNISYADLSDFFYVWQRRALRAIFPDLYTTVSVPKLEELIAARYRHGSKEKAEAFFLSGMTSAMRRISEQAHPAFPVTIYYAFKQSESASDAGTASTGWETFLDAVLEAGFSTTGTWPMRTELGHRMVGNDANALASSIVLVCRPRALDAVSATRRDFVAALKRELPDALRHLQAGNIAPVDLAQASIGPGMAVFTRFSKVLDASGERMKVREALALINQVLDESLAEQDGDFDADSRWALAWFEQYAFADGEYGIAETLSKAKNTSVRGLEEAGILKQGRGKVRLLKPEELQSDWDPTSDVRLTAWESVHHMIRALTSGEQAAAHLATKLGDHAEVARELAYRLYVLCERKKRAAEALTYNALVQSWPELVRLATEGKAQKLDEPQAKLFGEE